MISLNTVQSNIEWDTYSERSYWLDFFFFLSISKADFLVSLNNACFSNSFICQYKAFTMVNQYPQSTESHQQSHISQSHISQSLQEVSCLVDTFPSLPLFLARTAPIRLTYSTRVFGLASTNERTDNKRMGKFTLSQWEYRVLLGFLIITELSNTSNEDDFLVVTERPERER